MTIATAERRVRSMIERRGPLPWSEVVGAALYGPGGFYAGGGAAGRHRDFVTSVELGPLFGAVVARAIDAAWERCHRPDPWVVIEAGAGSGTLAAAVLAAGPRCATALRYLAVETSAPLRAVAAARLPVVDPEVILGTWRPGRGPTPVRMRGPLVAVGAELPVGRFSGVVLANELLDNLVFDVYQRVPGAWGEVRVDVADDQLVELVVPARRPVGAHLDNLAPDAPVGGRVPWQHAAAAWLRRALAVLEAGVVICFDYARPTAEMAGLAPERWLRTYRSGGRGGAPLQRLGTQDITVDVAVDQLSLVVPPTTVRDQAAWLAAHGLDELAGTAAAAWRSRAPIADLEALRARARMYEAATLSEPSGLGGFAACEWAVRAPD